MVMRERGIRCCSSMTTANFVVFIDGYPLTDDAGNTLSNVAGIAFKEARYIRNM